MTAVRIGTLILAPSLLASLLSPGDLPFEKGKARGDPGLLVLVLLLSGAESGVPERGCEIFVAFASEFFLGRPEPRHMRRNLVAFAREPVIFFFFAHCHLC